MKITSFWEAVKTGAKTDCWPWKLARDACGYGRVNIDGKNQPAHRVAYELHHGPLPEGHETCHACHTPECCNPHHLWAGTHRENMADMSRSGRVNRPRGERNPKAKLTSPDILAIRRAGLPNIVLADMYDVGTNAISDIRLGKTWAHLS